VPAVVDGELGGAWQALTIVPGRHPLAALASVLGDPALVERLREAPAVLARELRRYAGDRGLIVFVDQLEELITLGDPGEVAALDAGLARSRTASPGSACSPPRAPTSSRGSRRCQASAAICRACCTSSARCHRSGCAT